MNTTVKLGAALIVALLAGCSKPASQAAPAAKDDAGAKAAAALHAPIDKAKGVGDTLDKAAQDQAEKIKAQTDDK